MVQNEVIEFINRRFPIDCNWTSGNCYWFARMLCDRFSYLDVCYIADVGHFVAGDGIHYYDFNGEYDISNCEDKIYFLDELRYTEPIWYERIVRDCIK